MDVVRSSRSFAFDVKLRRRRVIKLELELAEDAKRHLKKSKPVVNGGFSTTGTYESVQTAVKNHRALPQVPLRRLGCVGRNFCLADRSVLQRHNGLHFVKKTPEPHERKSPSDSASGPVVEFTAYTYVHFQRTSSRPASSIWKAMEMTNATTRKKTLTMSCSSSSYITDSFFIFNDDIHNHPRSGTRRTSNAPSRRLRPSVDRIGVLRHRQKRRWPTTHVRVYRSNALLLNYADSCLMVLLNKKKQFSLTLAWPMRRSFQRPAVSALHLPSSQTRGCVPTRRWPTAKPPDQPTAKSLVQPTAKPTTKMTAKPELSRAQLSRTEKGWPGRQV